jgi:uncharacterized RDD family membrane protein YckC
MSDSSDFLNQEYTIDTPENVTFGYEIAGIGSRFIAALVDSTAIGLSLVVLNIILFVLLWLAGDVGNSGGAGLMDEEGMGWVGGIILAIYALLNFSVFWGYYILYEYLWTGQTPGKRLARVRVVRSDGSPIGLSEAVIRNLVRIVDFMPTGYAVGLVAMFFNRQDRRLGDIAANTLVVKERSDIRVENLLLRPQTLEPLGESARTDGLLMVYSHIRRLSAADYDLIQDALERDRQQRVDEAILHRLAAAIAAKLDMPSPAHADTRQFLREVVEVYQYIGRRSA